MDSRTMFRTAASLAIFFAFRLNAATITVNSVADAVADDGQCTLREAIVAATTNAASGASPGECVAGEPVPIVDTIQFAIPGSGVHTIQPAGTMPPVLEAVVIDGYTQPGSSPNTLAIGDDAVLQIEIDGSLMNVGADMLHMDSGGSTVRGLVFNRVQGAIIFVGFSSFSSPDNVIEGNFFGTDPSGTSYLAFAYTAVRADGANNRIGGTTPAARNVIAATGGSKTGTIILDGDGSRVQGNYIGVDATGNAPLQPDSGATNGIEIGLAGAATNTLIGGDVAGAGNVVLMNNVGINLHANSSANVTMQGNLINTNAAGSALLGYTQLGINAQDTVPGVIIGGSTPGAGNTITGAIVYAINIGAGASAVVVQGNRVGTDITGTRALPNPGNGIALTTNGGGDSIIGGTGAGEANTIANNCGRGIFVGSGTQWPILGNSIHSNGGMGISFNGNSPTPNDPGDGDTGPNNLQNYPVITSTAFAGGNVTLSGTLNSTAATTYRIEFFANTTCDATGYGEGETFIGTTDVTTDADGNASFGPLTFPAAENTDITATATDPDGNTSEFSQCAGPHDRMFASAFEFSCSGG